MVLASKVYFNEGHLSKQAIEREIEGTLRRLGTDYLYVTSLFVLLGILRYLQRTLVDNESGSPTRILLHDRFVQFAIAGWLLVFGIIIYS